MKRFEKLGELLIKVITYPLRAGIGVCRCVHKSTPDTLEDCMPFEIKSKKKEGKDATSTDEINI